jgi:hypothetical protein
MERGGKARRVLAEEQWWFPAKTRIFNGFMLDYIKF